MQKYSRFPSNKNVNDKMMFDIRTIKEDDIMLRVPHYQEHFEIVWLQKGTGIHIVEGETHIADAGKLFFALPGQLHQFNADYGAEGYIISFSEAFLTQAEEDFEGFHAIGLSHQLLHHTCITIQPDLQEELLEIAQKMLKESANYFFMRTEMLRRYLKIYLVHVMRLLETTAMQVEQKNTCALVRKFTSLLEQNFKEKKMVADYAAQLGVSANHLNFMVKKFTGYAASYHTRQRIVLEAKRKAVHSGFSMKQVAYYLGFDDIAHFSKFFKNAAGNNFSDFRRTIKKDVLSFTA